MYIPGGFIVYHDDQLTCTFLAWLSHQADLDVAWSIRILPWMKEILQHLGWFKPYLVGGLEHQFYFPIYWVANHPNWLSYFSEGFKPPTSYKSFDKPSINWCRVSSIHSIVISFLITTTNVTMVGLRSSSWPAPLVGLVCCSFKIASTSKLLIYSLKLDETGRFLVQVGGLVKTMGYPLVVITSLLWKIKKLSR